MRVHRCKSSRILARKASVGIMAAIVLLLSSCESFPQTGKPPYEMEVSLLSDAIPVRGQLGGILVGYLAEYTQEFQRQGVFLAMDIQKYQRGDRLKVRGRFSDDTVWAAKQGDLKREYPVLVVQRASPYFPAEPTLIRRP